MILRLLRDHKEGLYVGEKISNLMAAPTIYIYIYILHKHITIYMYV